MNSQQEEKLVATFSKQIKETFFNRIPASQWRVERVMAHYWLFGVRSEHIDTYPYLYSIYFDWKNRLFTLRLEQEVLKSVHIFPHIYYRLLHVLTQQDFDVLVQNDNLSLKQNLYKGKQVPLHATGNGAEQVIALLETLKKQIPSGQFYFWKTQDTVHFCTPFMPNFYHSIQLLINEKEHNTQGMIDINGQLFTEEKEIIQYTKTIRQQIETVQQKEQDVFYYVAQLHSKSYYDPDSESILIFKKNIPFSIKLLCNKNQENLYRYSVRFGGVIKESTSLDELIEEIKKDIYAHVLKDRLRAVVEGRI